MAEDQEKPLFFKLKMGMIRPFIHENKDGTNAPHETTHCEQSVCDDDCEMCVEEELDSSWMEEGASFGFATAAEVVELLTSSSSNNRRITVEQDIQLHFDSNFLMDDEGDDEEGDEGANYDTLSPFEITPPSARDIMERVVDIMELHLQQQQTEDEKEVEAGVTSEATMGATAAGNEDDDDVQPLSASAFNSARTSFPFPLNLSNPNLPPISPSNLPPPLSDAAAASENFLTSRIATQRQRLRSIATPTADSHFSGFFSDRLNPLSSYSDLVNSSSYATALILRNAFEGRLEFLRSEALDSNGNFSMNLSHDADEEDDCTEVFNAHPLDEKASNLFDEGSLDVLLKMEAMHFAIDELQKINPIGR